MSTGYSTKNAGAHLDELFFSPAVRIEAGREYIVRVRTRDRTGGGFRILTVPVVNPLTAGVQLLSALEVDGDMGLPVYVDDNEDFQLDDLVDQPAFVGEAEDGLVLVTEVRFDAPGSCSLSGVEFAPDLFDVPLLETPHTPRTDPVLLANTPPAAPVVDGDPFRRLTGRHSSGYSLYEFVIPLAAPPAFPTIARYRTQYRYHIQGSATNRSQWIDSNDVTAPVEDLVVGPLLLTNPIDVRVWAISTAGAPSAPAVVDFAEF